MYKFTGFLLITTLVIDPIITDDVCRTQCQCSSDTTRVNCDTKQWKNLDDIEFPSNVVMLTLNNNNLKFDRINDLNKIENLSHLTDLSINQNPLGIIPSFNHKQLRYLSLQDTFLTSAEFPSSYNNSPIQRISLNNNKIRSINEKDFSTLRNSQLTALHIDSSTISKIDQNAFTQLTKLQSLSLKNNQLTSCEFLSNANLLSSIQLDGNQFTSLPQQLATPRNIKTYSFRYNSISVIDNSSPLNIWFKNNYTNVKIDLANNTLDCCLSIWFIQFIKASPSFVTNPSLLTCTTPSNFAGQFLMQLNPDDMNCNGDLPNKSWWTTAHIIIVLGSFIGLIVIVIVITLTVKYISISRRHHGYDPLDSNNSSYPNIDTWLNDEHNDDRSSTYQSDILTQTTGQGLYAADRSQADNSEIDNAALLSHSA